MRKYFIRFGSVFISFVIFLITLFNRDNIIVNYGISGFRFSFVFSILLFVGCLIFCGYCFLSGFIHKSSEVDVIQDSMEIEPVSSLDISNKLDPVALRKMLKSLYDSCRSDNERLVFGTIISTMDVMDDMQFRLKELLDNNGADTLRDTEDILDHSEQYMCGNIRKFINSVTILDIKNPDDFSKISSMSIDCVTKNKKVLDLTKNFLESLVELLNKQDDNGCENEINMYREAINEQLEYSKAI